MSQPAAKSVSFSPGARAQAALPRQYKVPPLVRAEWQLADLSSGFDRNATAAFSEALCQAYGVRHCLLVDSARSGAYLLAKAMGLDGEWLFTAFGYRPMTLLLDAIKVKLAFADIGDDFNMSVASAREAIGGNTQALMVNHMFGKCADVRALRELADQRGLFLIENAVHVPPGLRVAGRSAGSWGDASLLSFNVDKPLGALAGGAVLTNRDDVWHALNKATLKPPPATVAAERILSGLLAYKYKPLLTRFAPARLFGEQDTVASVEALSPNAYREYRPASMSPLQAGVALKCLSRHRAMQQRRIENAERLLGRIGANGNLLVPRSSDASPHAWLYFPLVFRDASRIDVARAYARAGIETKWRYYPLHLQAGFSGRHGDLGKTGVLAQQYLLLPAGSCTTQKQIDYLADCTNRIADELSGR